jgi:hypothetical protein
MVGQAGITYTGRHCINNVLQSIREGTEGLINKERDFQNPNANGIAQKEEWSLCTSSLQNEEWYKAHCEEG